MKVPSLSSLKTSLLAHAMLCGALKFSNFTFRLKSGRMSPYFFNSGAINDARGLELIGRAYAAAIYESSLPGVGVLFGPPYKGIPLVNLAAVGLWQMHGINVQVAYARKEAKDHGEGGTIVGANMAHEPVLIIDDVISAGTAVKEAIGTIRACESARIVGVAVMLDRQEKGSGDLSAVQEVRETYGIPVMSVLTLDDIIGFIDTPEPVIESAGDGDSVFDQARQYADAVRKYRAQYGVS